MATILIIDPHFESRDILRVILESAGFGVLDVDNGSDGVATACQEAVDAIIMEMMVPRLAGSALIRTLRSAWHSTAPIIVLTADVSTEPREVARCGASSLLVKPCSPSALREELERLLPGVPARRSH